MLLQYLHPELDVPLLDVRLGKLDDARLWLRSLPDAAAQARIGLDQLAESNQLPRPSHMRQGVVGSRREPRVVGGDRLAPLCIALFDHKPRRHASFDQAVARKVVVVRLAWTAGPRVRVLKAKHGDVRGRVRAATISSPMANFPDNIVEIANAQRGGFNQSIGLQFVSITAEEVVAELTIDAQHKQPYGLVHGGVYSAMLETLCSTGAALNVMAHSRTVVGLENTTSFLKAVRGGRLRGVATPLLAGRRSHVWEGRVYDDEERLVATGRVRLIVLEQGATAGGSKVTLQTDETP